jgi:SnoaL-like protein
MTDTNTIPTATETIERYLQFWNSEPGEDQRALGRSVFNHLVSYRAPIGVRTGIDALVELTAEFAEHLPGLAVKARRDPDVHHDRARLQWELTRNGESFAEGTDILTFDADGRVASVTAFLDRAPEGFDPHAHD